MTTLPAKLLTNDEVISRMCSNIEYVGRHKDKETVLYINGLYKFYRDEAIIRGIDISELPRKLKPNAWHTKTIFKMKTHILEIDMPMPGMRKQYSK